MVFTRAMCKTDLDFLCKLIAKTDKEMIAAKQEVAKLFANTQKQIVVFRGCKPIICDKPNPDNYKK